MSRGARLPNVLWGPLWSADAMTSYRERMEEKKKREEEPKGHNHPVNEKCGPHCPRNDKYKGPVKKASFFRR